MKNAANFSFITTSSTENASQANAHNCAQDEDKMA
jgi:hypothetical protein